MHKTEKVEEGLIRNLQDTDLWEKDWLGPQGILKGDPRGVAFSFTTDEVNPYRFSGAEYLM